MTQSKIKVNQFNVKWEYLAFNGFDHYFLMLLC